MKKAFSLVELLVTLAIIGILGAIVMNVYNGISNSAIAVAQQKDTAELNQVMGMLHMSGGNIMAILAPSGSPTPPPDTQAYAFTYLLQGQLDANSMTQKGSVGNTLPTSEMIIPYPYSATDDSRHRIIFSPTGAPSIVTSGTGFGGGAFVVVSTTSKEGGYYSPPAGQYYNHVHQRSGLALVTTPGTGAMYSNLTGTKYANANSYIWNEDTAVYSGPGVAAQPPAPAMPPQIDYIFAYSPSIDPALAASPGTYNFTDYTGILTDATKSLPNAGTNLATVYAFAYRADGKDLTLGQISLNANFGGNAVGASYESLSNPIAANDPSIPGAFGSALSSQGSQKGLLLTVTGLNSVLPASSWTAGTESLAVTASSGGTGAGSGQVSASAVVLGTPAITAPAALYYNGAITVAANANDPSGVGTLNPTLTDSAGNVIPASSGSVNDTTDQIDLTQSGSGWSGTDNNTADAPPSP